jgi:cytochrome c
MKSKLFLIILLSILGSNLLYARGNTSTKPADVFKGCAKCHGKDGRNTAYGRSDVLAGQSVKDLKDSIMFFKKSTFERRGVMLVMSKQVKHLSEKDVENLAVYISKL